MSEPVTARPTGDPGEVVCFCAAQVTPHRPGTTPCITAAAAAPTEEREAREAAERVAVALHPFVCRGDESQDHDGCLIAADAALGALSPVPSDPQEKP